MHLSAPRRNPYRPRLYLALTTLLLSLLSPGAVWSQAVLENPQPGSFQSGIGLISGWACTAERIDIEVDGITTLQAAYGTARGDTVAACGDDGNNGFGLLVNWNILGDGSHTVRALRDGVEFARAAVVVATLGLGQFPTGLDGSFPLSGFPQAGRDTRVQWQESQQNFAVTNDTGVSSGTGSSSPGVQLENPQPGSFQSGIGLISGWACTAERIDIEVDGITTLQAAYGTARGDTIAACGDDGNNGFGLLVNWNLLGDGSHTVRVLRNGTEQIAQATFTVATLGLGEFPTGLDGSFSLPGFPGAGMNTFIRWQESQQNFVITGAPSLAIDQSLCTTLTASGSDPAGGNASLSFTNPCLAAGNTAVLRAASQTTQNLQSDARAQSTPASFFFCDQLLTFVQGNQTFTSQDFRLQDAFGNTICRTLVSGTTLEATVTISPGSALNFNSAFSVVYNGVPILDFPPRQTTSLDITAEGNVQASSTFGGNQFPAQLAVDGLQSSSWFSAGPEPQGTTTFLWTGRQDDMISSVAILSNALHENLSFRRNFGFGSVTIQVLTSSGAVVFQQSVALPGTPDPSIIVEPGVVGRAVRLVFSGHEDPECGGFSELQVVAER
ncbi:MAG: hypothetical protein AB7G75_11650 [Candidatus Binatia bacterium]